ncbi:hypothetical protein J4Q44_G00159760 [Coregonus suidteri]|uniref:Spermatogenesis-associated protein 1 C-terminal domain-containing protein n=1 Tax=Coregonus suidteri TaxID=861788 RepID=A0AAN8LU15_9TELE
MPTPTEYASPFPAPTLGTRKTAAPVFLTSRDELIEKIKMAKDERKQLEQTRQELLRKGKDLLAQNRHRRNQARNSWKRSYFDTKKATAPLEVTLRSLRQELEIFYNNILHQLKARDGGGKPRWQGRMSSTKVTIVLQLKCAPLPKHLKALDWLKHWLDSFHHISFTFKSEKEVEFFTFKSEKEVNKCTLLQIIGTQS